MELEEARNYADNIIKGMMSMLVVVNLEGKIKTINKKTEELLEYEKKELIGRPISVIFAEDWIRVEEIIKEGFVQNVDQTFLTKGGRKISVLLSSSVLFNLSSSPAQEVKYTNESVHIKLDLLPQDQLLSKLNSYLTTNINFSGKAEVDFNIPGAIVVHDSGNIAINGRDVFIESQNRIVRRVHHRQVY